MYSVGVVYNTFPIPPAHADLSKLDPLATAVLDARAGYPDASLTDLYDPDLMPPSLRRAHPGDRPCRGPALSPDGVPLGTGSRRASVHALRGDAGTLGHRDQETEAAPSIRSGTGSGDATKPRPAGSTHLPIRGQGSLRALQEQRRRGWRRPIRIQDDAGTPGTSPRCPLLTRPETASSMYGYGDFDGPGFRASAGEFGRYGGRASLPRGSRFRCLGLIQLNVGTPENDSLIWAPHACPASVTLNPSNASGSSTDSKSTSIRHDPLRPSSVAH